MTTKTYEIVSLTQATPLEREFLIAVETAARDISSEQIRSKTGATRWDAIRTTAQSLNLNGIRLDFINTQMELSHLHANMERNLVSQYSTMCGENENLIYGYALALAEDKVNN